MCLLFVWLENCPAENGFRIILANQRDEYYTRPTKPLDYWPDHPYCISGLDKQPGKEDGTWMGYNKKAGKVASLLNILEDEGQPSFKGRGFLVNNYLLRDITAAEYLAELHVDAPDYTPFNLVLLEKESTSNNWSLYYYSNIDDVGIRKLEPGVHAFGNSVLDKPFRKVCYGKEKFAEIVSQFNSTHVKAELEKHLLELMGDNEHFHGPDPQMFAQAEYKMRHTDLGNQLPRIFVNSKDMQYGSRTTQLFFMDGSGNCNLMEKNMEEPIDVDKPCWGLRRRSFHIDAFPTPVLSKV